MSLDANSLPLAHDTQAPGRSVSSRLAQPRASWMSRLSAVIVVMSVIALLVTARLLQPSPAGYGTHQQLGLPPCSTVVMWGFRCPACGMTTAWSYTLRGNWPAAWQANVGGFALVLIALAYIPAFCYYVAQGHWSRHGWLSFSLALSLSAALLAALGQWLVRIIQDS